MWKTEELQKCVGRVGTAANKLTFKQPEQSVAASLARPWTPLKQPFTITFPPHPLLSPERILAYLFTYLTS